MVLLSGLAALPVLSLAAGTATIQADHKTSQVEWLDSQTVRLDQAGEDRYIVLRDGKAYLVSDQQGQPRVMDMGEMAQTLNQVAKGLTRGGFDLESKIPEIDQVRDTGARTTVAGIQGETYRVTTTDSDGKQQTLDAVLTDDPRVTELTHAYLNVASALVSAQTTQKLQSALPANRQGILKVSGKYEIQSISSARPDAARFTLPAPPTNTNDVLQGIAKQLQQLQQQMR